MSLTKRITDFLENGDFSNDPIVAGELVRSVANDIVGKAIADTLANGRATIGVAASKSTAKGKKLKVVGAGRASVLLETGLIQALAPGDVIYVSATQFGRGTPVPPANPIIIGAVINFFDYASDNSKPIIVSFTITR